MTDNEEPRTVRDDADDAYNAIRAICHSLPYSLPGPTAYSILGNLKLAGGHMLRDLLAGMTSGLSRSLIDFDNYMDDKSDPALAVAKAIVHLDRARALAAEVGQELEKAQSEVARLGYRTPGDLGYRPPESRK
jgi:hypothetical protein